MDLYANGGVKLLNQSTDTQKILLGLQQTQDGSTDLHQKFI